jgi:hypothetical protein
MRGTKLSFLSKYLRNYVYILLSMRGMCNMYHCVIHQLLAISNRLLAQGYTDNTL